MNCDGNILYISDCNVTEPEACTMEIQNVAQILNETLEAKVDQVRLMVSLT